MCRPFIQKVNLGHEVQTNNRSILDVSTSGVKVPQFPTWVDSVKDKVGSCLFAGVCF